MRGTVYMCVQGAPLHLINGEYVAVKDKRDVYIKVPKNGIPLTQGQHQGSSIALTRAISQTAEPMWSVCSDGPACNKKTLTITGNGVKSRVRPGRCPTRICVSGAGLATGANFTSIKHYFRRMRVHILGAAQNTTEYVIDPVCLNRLIQ